MKKKTSVLLLILSVALVLISTAVLLMSIFGSSDFTDIRADLQGASAVYIDDEANAVYAYDGSLAKRSCILSARGRKRPASAKST